MKAVLVASKDQSACHVISTTMRPDYKVEATASREKCLDMFQRRRYEFLFIDVELLREGESHSYKSALKPFWHVYPTASIIVTVEKKAHE